MLYIGIVILTLALAVGVGFLWRKNATQNTFDSFLKILQTNQKNPLVSHLNLLSAKDKKKLWALCAQNAEQMAMSIQSTEILNALIVEGYDINLSHKYTPEDKNQKKKNSPTTPETLFTWALYQNCLNPPGEFSLAGSLLDIYKFDLFQLKKFEMQVKNSQLRLDIPLALRLRQQKNTQLSENQVGHLLKFTQSA